MRVLNSNKFISLIITVAAFVLLGGGINIASSATTWEKIIDFGDEGYSETGVAWRTYVNDQSHNGTYRYLSHWESDVARSGTATWKTTIPYDGLYRVAVSYRQTENRSPDANYFATNSSGGLDETVINQTGPLAYIWRTLGEYRYSAGQVVKVLLDGTDDNYSDCADAASWTLLDSPVIFTPILSLLLKPERVALTISKDGLGNGTITSIPGGISCGSTCSYNFIQDIDVVLEANPDRGSTFTGWSGSGCSGTGSCAVVMNTEQTINATFGVLPQYNLKVSITGTGTVSTSPVSADGNAIICTSGTCTRPYYQNETVTLTATEDRSSSFTGWTGDCTPTADPFVATVNMGLASKNCTATFVAKPQYNLAVTLSGTGPGTVTSLPVSADGNAINCTSGTCIKPYYQNETVTLTATEDRSSSFTGWTGDCTPTADPFVATVNMGLASKNCTATFAARTQNDLTVELTGTGSGTVTSSPVSADGNAINCPSGPCIKPYWDNDTVTLTPVAHADSHFVGWTGDPDCTDSVVIMSAAKTCIATFDLGLVQHTLTVNNGSCDSSYGDVSTSPDLINCSGTPGTIVECSADFDHNSAVTLTAIVSSGTFAGWLGDCLVTADPLVATVTMNNVKTCNAVFCGLALP